MDRGTTRSTRRTGPLLALAAALLMSAACTEDFGPPAKPSQPGMKPTPEAERPPLRGLEAGHPQLVPAVTAVLESCEVSELGYARRCQGRADEQLNKQERVVGVEQTMLTYCNALEDSNHLARALALARMNRMIFPRAMKEHASEELLACLMDRLASARESRAMRPLARAAAYMAPALEQDERIIEALRQADSDDIKAAGYGSLWANGRLRVFDELARVITEGHDLNVRAAAINSFSMGNELDEAERDKVCDLVRPLMVGDEVFLAAAAAARVANSCPRRRDDVLGAAEEMVERGTFDSSYVTAVLNVNGFFGDRATAPQKKRSIELLRSVLTDERFSDLTRSSALRRIAWIDRRVGVRLARRQRKSDSELIRRAAEFVLKGRREPDE